MIVQKLDWNPDPVEVEFRREFVHTASGIRRKPLKTREGRIGSFASP